MTRAFIAVALPEPTRLALERLQGALRGELPGLSWTSSAQLHLTIAFLGDVPTRDLDQIGDALVKELSGVHPFEILVQGLGAFPSPRRARVLWAGVIGEFLPHLDGLRRAVVRAASSAGHPPADDRFHPHVTLARAKPGRGPSPDLETICSRHRDWKAGPLPVASAELMASVLTPRGPNHTVLRSAGLGPTGSSP
ncbi:RNA 2',3'-cyclic phosphodiesterase [Tautonia sociabilis]|nr:RNA 2',3'-cyclic phosphodiesterase [Tautonia sociabilis]